MGLLIPWLSVFLCENQRCVRQSLLEGYVPAVG